MADLEPDIGMGATINHWSDRTPVTIVNITHKGKRLTLREDKATRTDNNGMSDIQSYIYENDPNGSIWTATLRKDGTYRISKGSSLIVLGYRRKYHDYSF